MRCRIDRVKVRLLTAGLLALAFMVAVPLHMAMASGREDARGLLARGLAALDAGQARTARIELMNAIKADPNWPAAHVAQARALLELGEGASAGTEIARARTLGARAATNRHLMAHALLLQGKAAEALGEAQAADVIAEQRSYAARMAGNALQALGRAAEAGEVFDRALALTPEDAQLWGDIGRFRFANGDAAGALVAVDRALALDGDDAGIMTLRATMVRDQYGLAASLPWFERALAIDREHVPALTEYGATLADMGQARAMLSLTRRVLALDPGNPRAYMMQAVMAARSGKYTLARNMLDHTHGALDGEPATLLLRGVLFLRGGNATLAAEQLGRLVAAQPFNQRARLLLGRAQYDAGLFGNAVDTLAPLASRQDADSYTLLLAARAQERAGDPVGAQQLLARASRPERGEATAFADAVGGMPADATLAAPNIAYIRSLIATGQAGAAVSRAQALLAANRGAPDAQIVLGDALSAAGRHGEAARAYEGAANIRFSENTALRLISAWRLAGDPARAAHVLSLYLGQNPQDLSANRLAATAYLGAEQWSHAVDVLEGLRARVGNGDGLLLANLAWAWLGAGDADRALVYAKAAYRLRPADPMVTDVYGWTMLQVKGGKGAKEGTRGAIDLLEKAAALVPGQPLVQLHLGKAYAAAGMKREAFAALSLSAAAPAFVRRDDARAALAAL
jgi:tetratricopeptide (TPR) repeat protein